MKKATVTTSSKVGIATAIRRRMKLREILDKKLGTLKQSLQKRFELRKPSPELFGKPRNLFQGAMFDTALPCATRLAPEILTKKLQEPLV